MCSRYERTEYHPNFITDANFTEQTPDTTYRFSVFKNRTAMKICFYNIHRLCSVLKAQCRRPLRKRSPNTATTDHCTKSRPGLTSATGVRVKKIHSLGNIYSV